MIELSDEFKKHTINRYEDEGKKWLNNIDKIIDKYVKKFKLTNLELSADSNINLVFFAQCPKYGKIVLKLSSPSVLSADEINYLKFCEKKYFEKCYFKSKKDKILILEKIEPGYDLGKIYSMKSRIEIFCKLLNNITTKKIPKNKFNTYDNLIKNRIKLVSENQEKYKNILNMVSNVDKFYNDIKNANLPTYVIHEDLHHKNILKSNNDWKIIDPHGIIAEKIFDCIQFIKGEISRCGINKMDDIVSLVANNINEDKVLLYKAIYVYLFSKIIYHVKINNTKEVERNINICNKILENLRE